MYCTLSQLDINTATTVLIVPQCRVLGAGKEITRT